ncbi:MAG: glycosyltransferase family 2 protein [Anaerolineales bacterium]|jgi:hypothetical protein|nr:glycosyltransferase family 2 protein [Anaerolineales bacterium]
MQLSMVITYKNERRLLRSNLLYHRFLGVTRFYLFDDGDEENTADTVTDLPEVVLLPSTPADRFNLICEYDEFTRNAAQQHVARQNLNTLEAKNLAQQEGIDWLISLDADELFCPDLQVAYRGQLLNFFDSVPEDSPVVRAPTFEIVQRRMDYEDIFSQEILFKRPKSKVKRKIYDPFTKRKVKINLFYGQGMGKSAIRPGFPAKPNTTHKFVNLDGSSISPFRGAHLLHYNIYSFEDFVRKFRNFSAQPDTWLSGNPIEYQRRIWRDMVNSPDFSETDLRSYYQRWILLSSREIRWLKSERVLGIFPKRSELVEAPAVRQVFEQLKAQRNI